MTKTRQVDLFDLNTSELLTRTLGEAKHTIDTLAETSPEILSSLPGIDLKRGQFIINKAKKLKMRKTIAQKVIEEREANGQELLGQTTGTYSFRKNSNLYRELVRLGLTENDVDVRTGARAGRNKNDGYQLLIFSKGE